MTDIEHRLRQIEQRNIRVETDKAWEVSVTRRMSIAILTYFTASLFLWLMNAAYPLIHSLVPTGGYVLSTLSLPWIKKWWICRKCHTKY